MNDLTRVAEAAKTYLEARRALAAHPDNDSTKRFDAKLLAAELAETELVAALGAAGLAPEEPEE